MIVPMKRLILLCVAEDSANTLEALRDLGAVHLELSQGGGGLTGTAKETLERAERALRLVEKAKKDRKGLDATSASLPVDEVLALDERREELKGELEALKATCRRYEPFGDFDPALAKKLEEVGVRLQLREDGSFEFLYGSEEGNGTARPLPLPTERLSVMQRKVAQAESEIGALPAQIGAVEREALVKSVPGLRDAVAFAAAADELAANRVSLGAAEGATLATVSGWIAADNVSPLETAAKANGWGLALRDPNADETPPTLIRPPKLFRPVKALFEGLGIAPAYTEADVSVPFMCYFSIFFAMLVGDGGYGAIILALALGGWWKYRQAKRPAPLMKSWLVLLTVFSVATVVWGFLSNTWFGAGLPFAAEWPTVKWLGDPTYGNMMLLCFTIGVSHLMIARIWTGLCMLNDRTCLAQFGWAGILLFMYLVTNSIVGIFGGIPSWAYWMFGVSLVLVFGFTLKGNELKSRGIELGMLPLNIMSALGDIISYVRLFAVGLASVKVAQNFNDMAVGLDLPLWLKIVPMVLILLVGHGLNFAMAGLSILVHAVRLNTLEFSNHKGVSWAGYAFKPFKRST
jgi:V/A-type H+-transporting ATPase subunit I